ncbi:MAG: polyprenol monophosphomannose synthase, partial [Candidatus Hydrothermae bacterium]|nr:polyprenol monophosphomannose synthase [Candidatus Hydrothermae bacterium]
GYGFQIEVNFLAWEKGFRLKEIPIIFVERRAGVSKMSKKIVWEAFWLVLSLRIRRVKKSILKLFRK